MPKPTIRLIRLNEVLGMIESEVQEWVRQRVLNR